MTGAAVICVLPDSPTFLQWSEKVVLPAGITIGLLWRDLARITDTTPHHKRGTTAPVKERKTMTIKALHKI